MKSTELFPDFINPEIEYRPEVRWWLAEGLNTDKTLIDNVKQIHDSGFGALEIVAMPEPHADDKIYGWGSDEWNSDTKLVIEEATKYNLGFSVTCGAHWACANLPNTFVFNGEQFGPDNIAAAQELEYETVVLKPGEIFDGFIPHPEPNIQIEDDHHGSDSSYKKFVFQGAISAKLKKHKTNCGPEHGYEEYWGQGELDISTLSSLDVDDNRLTWVAPTDGEYCLFFFWMHGTAQTAQPSVCTNYAINYLDKYGIKALIEYWEKNILDEEMRSLIAENQRGEMYMDSLELLSFGKGGVLWGFDLKKEFEKKRGYDVTSYLPLLMRNRARTTSSRMIIFDYNVSDSIAEKVRNDYNRTISELYEENTLKPLSQWLHSVGMKLRAEPSYGVNFEISTPAKYLDDVEIETYAQACDPDVYRGLSGSAFMFNRLFSSETGAVPNRNYYYNMDTWTNVCFLQFVCGVNRTVFHGYSAIEGSVEDTYWPGHEGMFSRYSERFNCRQPASLHYPLWTKMLSRIQKALNQGHPIRDIAILRTDCSFINYGQPLGHNTFENNLSMFDQPTIWNDLSLQHAGYTYDYFSPLLLLDENVKNIPQYQALVLYQESLDYRCAERLLSLAKKGMPIVFADGNEEIKVFREPKIKYEHAASKSESLGHADDEIVSLVKKIKEYPNVVAVASPACVKAALEEMKILPRISYDQPNSDLLCMSRFDEDRGLVYTFVYSFKYAVNKNNPAKQYTLKSSYVGKPYNIDFWTGEVRESEQYQVSKEGTSINITLKPGEAYLLVQNLSENEVCFSKKETCLKKIVELKDWSLDVEDWNEGERVINTETKFGHTTYEAYFTTSKKRIHFDNVDLIAWKELGMPEVSGVGYYKTTFDGCCKPDYLQLSSTGGGTAEVYLNGCSLGLMPNRNMQLNIAQAVKNGKNELEIVVATTLTNRMRQRHYERLHDEPAQEYGLIGSVCLLKEVQL